MDKERGVAQVRRIEPLSFSLGCLEGCKENEDSSLSFISPAAKNSPLCTNSLNRRKPKLRAERDGVRKSWDPSVKEDGSQEFWASIREPYDFIMGTNLIPDSYEMDYKDQLSSSGTELELLWDPDDVSPSYVWSFSEFLDQYNELYEWLIQIQLKLYASSTPHDKQLRIAQQEELMRRSYRRKLFLDQSEKVALTYPSSAEEVKWRVNYLNNKWEQLQTTLNTARFGPREENDIELDLAQEEYILRGWLNTMEEQIQPITCKLPRGCSLHALQERYKDNQILLKDIKAHGPILKSLFRQYERSVTPPAGSDVVPSSDSPTLKCSPEEGKDSVDSASLDTTKEEEEQEAPVKREAKEEFKSVPRKTKALEKRWHQVYLRSLEWHYYLEGVIADYKDQRSTCSSDCEDEEPVSKCRRLSGSSFSSCSSTAQFSRRRKKSCQAGWSDYEVNSSDAGSYIEDDYLTNSVGQLKACKVSVHEEGLNRTVKGALSKKKLSVVINSTELVGSIDQMETEGRIVSKDVPVKELEEGEDSLRRKNQRRNPSRKSYLTEVNRPSPNCGTFDYKHNDTDSDNNNNGDFDNSVSSKCGSAKRNRECQTLPVNLRKKLDSVEDDEVDQEELQRIIDHAILDQDWLNSNITSESEGSVIEDNADDVRPEESFLRQESMESESEEEEEEEEEVENNSAKEGKKSNDESPVKKPSSESSSLCKRESIHRLISGAEELVREPLKHPTIVTPRPQLKPLPFGIVEDSKQHRIKQWLSSQTDKNLSPNAHIIGSAMQDSCDASGELTTGESDVESIGSGGGFDTSLATQKGSGDLNLSSENTPTVEGLPSLASDNSDKVIRRVKRGQFKDHRPWSLGDHNLLMDDGVKELKGAEGGAAVAAIVKNAFSSSESALHLIPSYSQPKNLSNSQDDLKRSSDQMSNVSPTHDAAQKGRVSSSPPSSTNVPPSQKQAQNNSSDTPGSLRRRRTKYRRRSNNLLYRRGDFGFDESGLFGKLKDSKAFSYSPYNHPLTKSMSSDSDCVLEPSAGHRSYSFSGSAGKTGTVMTSSTEKGLSDFSSTSKGPPSPAKTKEEEEETPALIPTIKLPSSDPASPVSSLKRAPPASDQEASTHQEDISSLSEQAWDPYQEYKYLSEPYSEDLDLDAERKLLNFGDDYRKYIDSDGSSHWGIPFRKRRSPLQQQQQQQHQQLRRLRTHSAYRSLDSDSDLDDLHHVIGESKSQLVAMENVFDKFSSQSSLGLDFGEIIATARRNVKCLQDIWKHLSKETPDLQSEIGDVQGILERWEALQTKALEQQRQSTQLRQLQRQVKSLRLSLENILRQCSSIANPLAIESPSQFPSKLEEVKGLLSETETLRQDLSNLNILVHRFSSETGFAATPLKDEMAELYRMWDETHRRVSGEFSRLQNAELCWHLWEEQKANLSEALKQDFNTLKVIDAAIDNGKLTDSVTASVRDVAKLLNERRNAPNGSKAKILLSSESAETKLMELKNKTEVKEDRLSDSGTSGYESCSSDDLSERERRLAYLRRLARDLEATLVPGSKAWEDINNTLAQAEKELKELQDHCRSLIHRTTEALDPSVKHSRFHTNNKRRNISREGKNCRVTRSERRGKNGGSRKEWIWRVARAAVPFQAALLLLLCVTCLLEPSCCDSVNTFNLSFGPQLRFVPGSPPV